MPRYLIVTEWCSPATLGEAERDLPTRFPELSVESSRVVHERCWHLRCDAPSDEHARRWLAAFGIGIHSVTSHTNDDDESAS